MAEKQRTTGRKKDPARTARTREALLDAGYDLFTKKNIDSVSMQEIADAAGFGIATVYRYYRTKPDLVVAVAASKWRAVLEQTREGALLAGETETAAEGYARFLDSFLELYRNDKDLLRFNQVFNIDIRSTDVGAATLEPLNLTAGVLRGRFGRIYKKAETDKTLTTDVPEGVMFGATLHLMLAAITRYATGLVYLPQGEQGAENELRTLKHALLLEYGAERGRQE